MDISKIEYSLAAYGILSVCLLAYLIGLYNFHSTVKKNPTAMSRPFEIYGKRLPVSIGTFGIILYIFLALFILVLALTLLPNAQFGK